LRRIWETEQNEMDLGEVLQGRETVVHNMLESDLLYLHTYVIMNSVLTEPLLKYGFIEAKQFKAFLSSV
jgi:hypothetical protein